MPLNHILVCLDSGPAGDERLAAAMRLASASQAHLVGVYPLYDEAVEAVLFPAARFAMAGLGTGTLGMAEPGFAEPLAPQPGAVRAELAAQRFQESLRLHGLAGDWHMLDGADTAELIELAKTADLVVAGQFERSGRGRTLFRPEDIAMGSGRPILIIPYAGNFATIGARVLVAWDATREAARAVNDALPLMRAARSVTVMTVVTHESERGRAQESLERIVGHLGHHGIAAQSEAALRGDLGVSDVLLSRASDLSADLIVAGLYHHSPYREAIFGGVTHDLLDHMTVPILMSH